MEHESKQQLVIGVTYTFDETGTKASLNRVEDALQNDITEDFRLFAHQRNIHLDTQQNIEQAAREFVEARKNLLP